MRQALFVAAMVLLCSSRVVFADEYVHGYQRQEGTGVQPHDRSEPDGNPHHNESYPGDTNPPTGETAPGDPDSYLQSQQQRQHDQSLDLYHGIYGR